MRALPLLCLGLLAACSHPVGPAPAAWTPLDTPARQNSWKPVEFLNTGEVSWSAGVLRLGSGEHLTGVVWEGPPPATDHYELELEARRTGGFDFFCALTFPVGETSVTFVPGGWTGGVTGLSCVDGKDASQNATKTFVPFDDNTWYRLRVKVTPQAVEGFVDGTPAFRQERAGHTLGLRHGDIGKTAPLGLSSYNSTGEIRGLRWRSLR